MRQRLLRHRRPLVLLFLCLLCGLFSLRADWVESYYTYGLYPLLSRVLRGLLGWIPFSLGDLLYLSAGLFLLVKTVKLLRLLARRQLIHRLRQASFWNRYLSILLSVYLAFQLLWGLNYHRLGIAHQLQLDVGGYQRAELILLTQTLHQRLNAAAALVDTVQRQRLDRSPVLFSEAVDNYGQSAKTYSWLHYPPSSIKNSLFGTAGKYFGYTGYINPFTNEAQLKASIPAFVKPFVIHHEIAHQLGYGKENEASFVSFLVSRQSASVDFRYSVYYELFWNAGRECRRNGDTSFFRLLADSLHPRVLRDREAYRQYLSSTQNAIEPLVSEAYDRYLRLNNQPQGKRSYDEVILWLIAYMKKFGVDAL